LPERGKVVHRNPMAGKIGVRGDMMGCSTYIIKLGMEASKRTLLIIIAEDQQ
jgi:hypothetical protein